MKTYKSNSTVRPDAWDKLSCPDKVYHHTDIREVTTQGEDGDSVTMYEYTVTEYTNKEYIAVMDGRLDEQDDALIELAGLIAGGE